MTILTSQQLDQLKLALRDKTVEAVEMMTKASFNDEVGARIRGGWIPLTDTFRIEWDGADMHFVMLFLK